MNTSEYKNTNIRMFSVTQFCHFFFRRRNVETGQLKKSRHREWCFLGAFRFLKWATAQFQLTLHAKWCFLSSVSYFNHCKRLSSRKQSITLNTSFWNRAVFQFHSCSPEFPAFRVPTVSKCSQIFKNVRLPICIVWTDSPSHCLPLHLLKTLCPLFQNDTSNVLLSLAFQLIINLFWMSPLGANTHVCPGSHLQLTADT